MWQISPFCSFKSDSVWTSFKIFTMFFKDSSCGKSIEFSKFSILVFSIVLNSVFFFSDMEISSFLSFLRSEEFYIDLYCFRRFIEGISLA